MLDKQILAKKELALYAYDGEDKIISSHELAELLKQDEGKVFSFKTGLGSLDRLLGDVEAGELSLLPAQRGMGRQHCL